MRSPRAKIKERTGGLTASAGIAPNSRLAKVCSDMNKPDGQFRLAPDEGEIMRFVEALPIRKISGIGNVTEQGRPLLLLEAFVYHIDWCSIQITCCVGE